MKCARFSVAIFAALLFVVFPSNAQTTTSAKKPTPRTADGHPDLTGFYNGKNFVGDPVEETPGQHVLTRTENGSVFFNYGGANEAQLLNDEGGVEAENPPPYKPEYTTRVKEIANSGYGATTALDPVMECKPLGIPRGVLNGTGPTGVHIVQTPQLVVVLYEAAPGPYYRVIYTDGRKHPDNFDSSFFGHSVGHWEGDTLVVDTVGLNDETWLGRGQGASIHSDQLHVVERWTRDGDTVKVQAVVEDPVMFTKPWVMTPETRTLGGPADYLMPQMCVGLDKGHLVKASEKDPAVCGFCNSQSLYGLSGQGITTGQPIDEKK